MRFTVPSGYEEFTLNGVPLVRHATDGALLVGREDAETVPASFHSVTAAASALLSSLITINANLRALTLKPRSGKTVYINLGGAASAATFELVALSLTISKAVADTIYVYSGDAGPNLDIIQHV